MAISSPVTISQTDIVDQFECGEVDLDIWIKHTALKNHQSGSSKVFVIKESKIVIGYYCLAAGAINREEAPRKIARNAPNPLPVILLGRLAVHKNYKGCGIGEDLLGDAIKRTLAIKSEIGLVAIVAHAISQSAKNFYMKYGFIESSISPMTMILPLRQ